MDIKKKLKSVEKKIVSLAKDFNEEETFLILNNEKLLKEYVFTLAKNPDFWKEHEVLFDDPISIDYLDTNELTNVIENILFSFSIKNNSLSFSIIDEIVREYDLPSGTRDNLARKLAEIILSEKYDLFDNCDTYAMAILIKNDKKKVIANIRSFDGSITEKMLEKYYQYCLKNGITPTFDNNNFRVDITFKYLDYYSFDDLIRIMTIVNNEDSEELKLKVYNKIIERIMNSKEDIKMRYKLGGIAYKLPIDRVNNLYKSLYDKDYLVYSDYLLQNNIISEDELQKRVKNYCLSRDVLDEMVLKSNITYLDDKEILLHIASTNQIQILFSPTLIGTYLENKEEIKKEVLKNKQLPQLLDNLTFNIICKNSDLTLALAKNGFLKTLIVDARDSSLSSSDAKLFERLLDEYKLEPKFIIKSYSLFRSTEIMKVLIKKGYLAEFIKLVGDSVKETAIIKENLDIIIEYLDNNISALDTFTERFVKLILGNNKLLTFYAENDIFLTELLLSKINKVKERTPQDFENLVTPQFYKIFKANIVKLYNIKEENLDYFYKKFGPDIVAFLDNENMRKLINLDKEDFKKIMDLFPNEKLSMSDLSNAYLSIREYAFPKENPEEAEIFSLILQSIKEDNQENIDYYLKDLDLYFDDKLFDILNNKYKLVESGFDSTNHYKLLLFIITKIKMSPNKEKYTSILHIICDYYIACKRTEFANIDNMGEILYLPHVYSEKGLDEKITKYIVKYETNKGRLKEILRELINKGFSKEEISEIFYLIRGVKKIEDLSSETKYKIKQFRNIIYEYVVNNNYFPLYQNLIKRNGKIKLDKVYSLDNTERLNILKILSNLNIESINSLIHGDEIIYASLKELFTKKKIHMLPKNIINILKTDNISINYTEENIAAIINYYLQIYSYEQKKVLNRKKKKLVEITEKINELIVSGNESKIEKLKKKKKQLEEELTGNVPAELTTIQALLCSDTYNAVSSVFALILTPEDARLIKDNPDPNSAVYKTKNNERLKESVELTKKIFTRNEVTVPTFNKVINLNDNTSIRVILGNFTDPTNLTHGERTNACMRIGGVGENLFYNALNNKNAFHIKFEDPKTGAYISRVTGFRIGNTVFLNELKASQDLNLATDSDLIEALKIFSSSIIKESKKSSYPIENVIISNNCIFLDYSDLVDLEIGEEGESIGEIYNNINPSACIVLATSSYDKFAPINFNKENYPSYLPARRTVKEIKDKNELIVYVNRIEAIKSILAGTDYRLLSSKYIEQDILYAVANDEWYIYVDVDNNIYSNCIDFDERAELEYKENLEKVDSFIQKITKQHS